MTNLVLDENVDQKPSDYLISIGDREPLQIEKDYLDGLIPWHMVLEERKRLGLDDE